jgi:hypothetical protein
MGFGGQHKKKQIRDHRTPSAMSREFAQGAHRSTPLMLERNKKSEAKLNGYCMDIPAQWPVLQFRTTCS